MSAGSTSTAFDRRRTRGVEALGNGRLGRGLRRRQKNGTEAGARRFEKPTLDARAAPPEAHESFIGRKTVTEVPLTGLSLRPPFIASDIAAELTLTVILFAGRLASARGVLPEPVCTFVRLRRPPHNQQDDSNDRQHQQLPPSRTIGVVQTAGTSCESG